MSRFVLSAVFFVVFFQFLSESFANDEKTNDQMWEAFKAKFNKSYESKDVELMRKQVFLSHVENIGRHNVKADLGQHTYTLGINQFSDMTHEDFKSIMLAKNNFAKGTPSNLTYMPALNSNPPINVDWRTKGYVTPIKNQGQCGSCWAFSSTGAIEGQHFRKYRKLVSLSEQNLVDCTGYLGNQGCQGGWMDKAFQYVRDNKGIDTETAYPYYARQYQCRYNPSYRGSTVRTWVDIARYNENALKYAVANEGPVSVAIDATHPSFMSYRGGLYYEQSCSQTKLDHAVLVVGYGTTSDNRQYWLVKNSWGTNWGEQGYIRMYRNYNLCGIATKASYPLL